MTENDAYELNRPGAHDAVLWVFENQAYGHLDDIPDEILFALFKDYTLCGQACHICFASHVHPTDDPIELQKSINKMAIFTKQPFIIFRAWITLESARRVGLFTGTVPDMLLREICVEESFPDFPETCHSTAEFWIKLRDRLMEKLKIKEIKV